MILPLYSRTNREGFNAWIPGSYNFTVTYEFQSTNEHTDLMILCNYLMASLYFE